MLKHYERVAIIWAANLEPLKKLLLLALNEHLDGNGECWPGQKKLAEMSGAGLRTVGRKLKEMEGDGILIMRDRFDTSGRQTSSLYHVDFECLREGVRQIDAPPRDNPAQGYAKSTHSPRQSDAQGYAKSTHPLRQPDAQGYAKLADKQIPEEPLQLTSPKEPLSQASERENFVEEEFRAYVTGCLRPTCKGNLTAYVNTTLRNDREDWLVRYQKFLEERSRNDSLRAESTNPKDFAVNSMVEVGKNSASADDLNMRRANFIRAWETHPEKREQFKQALKQQPRLGLFVLDGKLEQMEVAL